MAVPARPGDDSALAAQILAELRQVRESLDALARRVGALEQSVAAHPPPPELREALGALRVLESQGAERARRLAESEGALRALEARVAILERSGVGTEARLSIGGRVGWLLAGTATTGTLGLIVWAILRVAGG